MSINKNRKFRFTFGDFVCNSYEPATDNESESRDKTITKDLSKMTVHRPQKEGETLKLSPQDQKRLEVMAKQAKANGGNSSGFDADYLSKIPAKQHNMITMQCAGDKVKELKDKMNEEILKTSPDEATTDILTETANDNIIYKDYDMSSLDAYMEKIDTMSMLESISLKNSITRELNRLESCHTMVKAVDDLRENFDFVAPGKEPTLMDRKMAGTNVDKQILTANYLDEYGYNESAEDFNKLYEAYQPKLEEMITKINTHIDTFSEKAASTQYMTEDFLRIIDKKIRNMNETDINYEHKMKGLKVLKDAFEHRTNLDFLAKKLHLFAANKTHLKNLVKAFEGTFSNFASKLNNSFATRTLNSFINAMDDCFDGDRYEVLTLLYFLNYVCSSEGKNSGDAWVKVLVLNIADIRKGIWDLDMHYDSYLASIANTFYPDLDMITDYLRKRKVNINSQIMAQYDALMNWVEPVKEEEKKEEKPQTAEMIEPSETMPIEHVEAEVFDATPAANGTVIDAEVTE